jgi:acyl-coenzyme A synthetase/AMP-(fatty) acid ligase
MATLRFADLTYFQSGLWEEDLIRGLEPVLIDPKWQGTSLENQLTAVPQELRGKTKNLFWIATSGSSGAPKLIQKHRSTITKEALFWKEKALEILGWTFGPEQRFLVTVPLCHLYGLVWGYELPKMLGASVHFVPPSKISEMDFQAEDLLIAVPYFLKVWKEKAHPLPKRIISSGSKFPVPLAQSFRSEGKVDIREIYGSTETGAMGQRNPMWKARFTLLPMVSHKLTMISEEEVLKVKSELVSEIGMELKSNQIDEGKAWEEIKLVDNEGYFVTNDCGDYSEIGWNHYGRIDRIAKVKGKRISLDTIESMISAIPGVEDVAVISYPHDEDAQIGCMVHSTKNKEEILNVLKATLPASHIPNIILITSIIPKLPNGKTNYASIMRELI